MEINKIKYLLFLSIFFIPINTKGQIDDCSNFKTGIFKYCKDGYEQYTITRNDSIQIETNSKDDIKVITSVEWVSECEYILTYLDILNFDKKNEVIGKKINIEITKTQDEFYTCMINSEIVSNEILKFIKIKEITK